MSTRYATRMPEVIINWLNDTVPPRFLGGVCSAMSIGATNDAVPTARPSTPRATISSPMLCATADASAATVYVLSRSRLPGPAGPQPRSTRTSGTSGRSG
jgi:hypothetical protein